MRWLRYYVLDADNRPVAVDDFEQWAEFIETGNRTVGMTQITSEIMVSTVFLGLDHRFRGGGPPLLFETMVFGGPLDQAQQRYASYDDAEIGHKAMVRTVRAAIGQRVTQ